MESKGNHSNTRTISTPKLLTIRQVHAAFQRCECSHTGPRSVPAAAASPWQEKLHCGLQKLTWASPTLSCWSPCLCSPEPATPTGLPQILFFYLIITSKEAFNFNCTHTLYKTAFPRKVCCTSEMIWDTNVLKNKHIVCRGSPRMASL